MTADQWAAAWTLLTAPFVLTLIGLTIGAPIAARIIDRKVRK